MRGLAVMGAEELVEMAQIRDAAVGGDLGKGIFSAAQAAGGEIHPQGVDEFRRALAQIAPRGAADMGMGASGEAHETCRPLAEDGRVLRGKAGLGEPSGRSLGGRFG